MPELDEIRDEVEDLLREELKDLWDGEEDTDFIKEVGGDLAKLRFKRLTLRDEDKESFKREMAVVDETLKQKGQQKKNRLNKKGQVLLPRILSVLVKALGGVL